MEIGKCFPRASSPWPWESGGRVRWGRGKDNWTDTVKELLHLSAPNLKGSPWELNEWVHPKHRAEEECSATTEHLSAPANFPIPSPASLPCNHLVMMLLGGKRTNMLSSHYRPGLSHVVISHHQQYCQGDNYMGNLLINLLRFREVR